ncbi:hypothetical protein EYC84_008914 [Monilinia fructicola]|uniref:Uncharacterized protein n=1 Tax=Monilinia fructicola TaxID=38448 RepID=A0A5M9JF51_MONFR|nr:hypothetical protein EYC84_008914 [Monilinia fructicola]
MGFSSCPSEVVMAVALPLPSATPSPKTNTHGKKNFSCCTITHALSLFSHPTSSEHKKHIRHVRYIAISLSQTRKHRLTPVPLHSNGKWTPMVYFAYIPKPFPPLRYYLCHPSN